MRFGRVRNYYNRGNRIFDTYKDSKSDDYDVAGNVFPNALSPTKKSVSIAMSFTPTL